MVVSKPLLTEFSMHCRLESSASLSSCSKHFFQAEDDVETMCCVIDCYSDLLLHGGYSKGSTGSTRVALQVGKHSVDNPLLGRKSWTRRVHIQRLTMHYQQRAERRTTYSLTKKHVTAIEDLVTLSLSHYSQVSKFKKWTYIFFPHISPEMRALDFLKLYDKRARGHDKLSFWLNAHSTIETSDQVITWAQIEVDLYKWLLRILELHASGYSVSWLHSYSAPNLSWNAGTGAYQNPKKSKPFPKLRPCQRAKVYSTVLTAHCTIDIA